MFNNIFASCLLIFSLLIISCNNTENETTHDTNTHNTSQPSAAAHTKEIKIDARSRIPASRLNDGNLETRASNRNIAPGGITSQTNDGTQQQLNSKEGQADVDENQEIQNQEIQNQEQPIMEEEVSEDQ